MLEYSSFLYHCLGIPGVLQGLVLICMTIWMFSVHWNETWQSFGGYESSYIPSMGSLLGTSVDLCLPSSRLLGGADIVWLIRTAMKRRSEKSKRFMDVHATFEDVG